MPDNYTDVFGGQNRSPAQLDYVFYEISEDITLEWPFLAPDGAYIAPNKIDIEPTAGGLRVFLPSAMNVSVGQDILIRNVGASSIKIVDPSGGTIIDVASGEQWFLWLTDTSTIDGEWGSVQFGAGVSNANAAALAGAGLKAVVTRLDQNLVTTTLAGNYAITASDRATVIRNNGGVVIYTVADAAVLGIGWFCYVSNGGSGAITVDPNGAQTIDGASTKSYSPGESSIIFSDGANLFTIGYGRSLLSIVSGTTINTTGGTSNLTSVQIAAQVQNWTGALVSNAIFDYQGAVGYWFVYNNTSGAFSVTARVGGLDSGVAVPQGSFSIIRSDGANMTAAFTAAAGTVTSVGTTVGELTGGPITTTGTLGLANTAVVPGTYGSATSFPNVTLDAKGRATAASSVPLGTAAFANTGSGAGQVVLLDSAGLIPSVNGGVPTAAIMDFGGSTLPAGWIWAAGTIGNAASGATNRANADTLNLYTVIWNTYANAQAPVSGGRGVSAAADFAANKTITVMDYRGRFRAGRDTMGAFGAANRITGLTAAPNGNTMGAIGGLQVDSTPVTVTSVTGGIVGSGSTVGSVTGPNDGIIVFAAGGAGAASQDGHMHGIPALTVNVTGTFSGSGSGTASYSPMPPFMLNNVIIKL
jgi:hypothetical protein